MKPFIPSSLYELSAGASDPRLSPDGTRLIFSIAGMDESKNEYTSQLWIAESDGGSPPRELTLGEHRDSKARWSPDGTQIAFVTHREDKGSQLFILPVSGGEPRQIASHPEEIEEPKWSPDGQHIAFLARDQNKDVYDKEKPKDQPARRINVLSYRLDSVGWTIDRPRQLFIVPSDGASEPSRLTDGMFEVSSAAWSPSGSDIAITSTRHDGWDIDRLNDIFILKVTDGSLSKLTQTDGLHSVVSWSPDGKTLAFGWNRSPLDAPRNVQIATIDIVSGNKTVLTESLDRNCLPFFGAREPLWVSEYLYFLVEDFGNQHLYKVASDGTGKPEVVQDGHLQVTSFDANEHAIAWASSDSTTPPVIWTDKSLTTLSPWLLEAYSEYQIVKSEEFFATSKDGSEVQAWIIKPANFEPGKKYPAVLNIHGGPFTQYGNKIFDEFQIYANAGYAVIYSNPRGSAGYSEAWGRAIRGPQAPGDPGTGWGGVDYDDLMAVVDEAERKFDFVDSSRLGVMGGSYGGFMTTWIIGHNKKFKAAISERAVNNHLSMCWTSDIGPVFRSYFGPMYLDDPDSYLEMSPITYVRNIETPVLILHSENDLRCPISQAEELFSALRILEKDVEFVRFPGESHELSRSGSPKHRVERFEVILDYLDKKL